MLSDDEGSHQIIELKYVMTEGDVINLIHQETSSNNNTNGNNTKTSTTWSNIPHVSIPWDETPHEAFENMLLSQSPTPETLHSKSFRSTTPTNTSKSSTSNK